MADTVRTQAALLTSLFQDSQANNSISPQDMRDLILTLTPAIGGLYISTAAATTISTVGTFVKASGTTTISAPLHNITMPQDGRLTYGDTVERHFNIIISMSAVVVGNNQDIAVKLYKNGTGLDETEMNRHYSSGTNAGSISITHQLHLAPTDYVEIWIANNTSTGNITLNKMVMSLTGFIV